jgi:cation diffusion facilitator CzcD-associated flavoprotein CzcO
VGTQHIETLVIGAGQAGLSTGYHLQRLGRPFLIVDGNERVGDNWRQQWDSLRLYTPAKYDGLPGLRFPAEPWTYPGKEHTRDERGAQSPDSGTNTTLRPSGSSNVTAPWSARKGSPPQLGDGPATKPASHGIGHAR